MIIRIGEFRKKEHPLKKRINYPGEKNKKNVQEKK